MENPVEFVQWLRSVAPYIHAFRGKTFVVAFPGELVAAGALPVLAHDLSLLHALGIKVAMITGDNRRTGEAVARKLGIDEVIAEVLPGDKLALGRLDLVQQVLHVCRFDAVAVHLFAVVGGVGVGIVTSNW